MADVVYLRWFEGQDVFQAIHLNVKDAQAQADGEPMKKYLGVFDGPEPDAKKLADAGGSGS